MIPLQDDPGQTVTRDGIVSLWTLAGSHRSIRVGPARRSRAFAEPDTLNELPRIQSLHAGMADGLPASHQVSRADRVNQHAKDVGNG